MEAEVSAGAALVIALIMVVVLILILILVPRVEQRSLARIRLRLQLVGAETYFPVGTAVAGLPGATKAKAQVVCAPGTDDLVFMYGHNPGNPEEPAPELGRISRDAVSFLGVRDATQMQKHVQTVQRLSVTRMAVLGPFSLAAPKRKKVQSTTTIPKFYLTIQWTDGNGIGQETVFQFAKGRAANQAESMIRGTLRRQIVRQTATAVRVHD
jgi:hypothetical protein